MIPGEELGKSAEGLANGFSTIIQGVQKYIYGVVITVLLACIGVQWWFGRDKYNEGKKDGISINNPFIESLKEEKLQCQSENRILKNINDSLNNRILQLKEQNLDIQFAGEILHRDRYGRLILKSKSSK